MYLNTNRNHATTEASAEERGAQPSFCKSSGSESSKALSLQKFPVFLGHYGIM
jgi:hypothetical protein